MSIQKDSQKVKRRVHHFAQKKQRGEKFTVVTAYDYPTAIAADSSNADAILVGDSLGMVALGFDSTIPVTLDIMVHHTAAVKRGVKSAFIISDMPFLTYHRSRELSVMGAGRLIQEGGAEAVKMEGGQEIAEAIKAITEAGIPVMGHVGLVPQSVHKLGGYRVQGKDEFSAKRLIEDALAVQEAGAFSIVIEAMPADVAAEITEKLVIPTVGIGAGRHCDGQVLVMSDLVGLLPGSTPKFVKRYAELGSEMQLAVSRFCSEVQAGQFPEDKHEY